MNKITSKKADEFYDSHSLNYDEIVEKGQISSIIRSYLHEKLSEFSGKNVLDIGCGTGTDAIFLAQTGAHVTAIDPSQNMLELAMKKAACLKNQIEFIQLSGEEINNLQGREFDCAYSDLDALNYIENPEKFSCDLAALMKHRAKVYLVMLNKACYPEWFFYMITFKPALAFKKLFNRAGTLELKLNLYFPGKVKNLFSRDFNCKSVNGFGIFLPPDNFSGLYRRFKWIFKIAGKAEQLVTSWFLFYNFCDHYIVELEKK